ncbi:isochorismate synthase [Yaniella halotolerans]|uniref:isochorismate synthase n=1 Tax=Yaniella halotolerans TaxID=225453 RepID=UPI0003B55018|nr:isochorismate synthase [Yaniella halotolerans]
MSFTAAAFSLTDAQLAQLPDGLIGKATCAFARNRRGKLGFGERYRFTTSGPQRFAQARDRWSELTASAATSLHQDLTASSPLCFAAFTFDARSAVESLMVVPKFVLDRTAEAVRLAYIYEATEQAPDTSTLFQMFLAELPEESGNNIPATFCNDAAYMSEDDFQQVVGEAVQRINQEEFSKVVLARDERVHAPAGFHIPATMRALANDNPTAWTYKVGPLIGSTPELLIARKDNDAKARVLAGTVDRNVAVNDDLIAEQLSKNPKQIFEHQAAVDSLVEKLSPFATALHVSAKPFVLSLPNVYHLATDVSAELTASTSVLDLVAEINPTAAVGGTPRRAALDAIWQLEAEQHGMDRGLYAGAVGWLNASGHGEFGIALRGSVIEDEHHVRIYAGCGIVDGSDAAAELAETNAKMRPMKKALRMSAN